MKNKYGLPEDILAEIRKRDQHCVYCGIKMPSWKDRTNNDDFATIEHVYPPGNDPTWVFFCCNACNLRHKMPLREWFKTDYCIKRNINENTVSDPVKKFLASGLMEYSQLWLGGKEHNFLMQAVWTFAKTMPDMPHEYVVRSHLNDLDKRCFENIANEITKTNNGYTSEFLGNEYKYVNYYGYKYWVIDDILNRELETT